MAPTITSSDFGSLSNKEKHKLRKPVVEKMRRDRINHSIEQLKAMLEFHKQDPNTKLEKADILEMTVVFLKQYLQAHSPPSQPAQSDAYSQCWRETLHLLASSPSMDSTALRLGRCPSAQEASRHCSPVSEAPSQHSPDSQDLATQKTVWRPW